MSNVTATLIATVSKDLLMPMTSIAATLHMLTRRALVMLTTMAKSQLKAVLKNCPAILQTKLTAVLKGAALVVTPVLHAVVADSPSTLDRLLTTALGASIVKPIRLLKRAAMG